MVERVIPSIRSFKPNRPPLSHKGNYGRIAVIAGSKQMLGAAILTAKSAIKSGAGLVYLLTVSDAIPLVNTQHPELIVCELDSKDGFLTENAFKQLDEYHKHYKFDVIAIGPGLGRTDSVQKLIQKVIYEWVPDIKIPCVIDADGLMAISGHELSKLRYSKYVLTPHPKEFEAIFDIKVDTSDDIRIKSAINASKISNQTIVLKGHHSIVASKNQYYLNLNGNPGMATAGAGDVLTGVIASLMGQHLIPFEATMCGVYLHGKAGDMAFQSQNIGLSSTDIIEKLPESIQDTWD